VVQSSESKFVLYELVCVRENLFCIELVGVCEFIMFSLCPLSLWSIRPGISHTFPSGLEKLWMRREEKRPIFPFRVSVAASGCLLFNQMKEKNDVYFPLSMRYSWWYLSCPMTVLEK
jgi:hypothetical protein